MDLSSYLDRLEVVQPAKYTSLSRLPLFVKQKVRKLSMTPLVSVIMPVFNGSRTVSTAIQSLIQQTETNWELIVTDDGSTDGGAEEIRAREDPRVIYTYQPNLGRSVARNNALGLASGKYVLFLDADDWLLPNALRDHVAFLEANSNFGVSISDGYFCSDQGERLATLSVRRGLVQPGDVLARIVLDSALVGAPLAACIRHDLIRQHHLRFDPALFVGEDWLFFIEAASHTQFGFISAVTCGYRWHSASTTQSTPESIRKDQLWRGRAKVMDMPFFPGLSPEVRHAFMYEVLVTLLQGRLSQQQAVLASSHFRDLPRESQSRLLRLAASDYLAAGTNAEVAKSWLKVAGQIQSRDPRSRLLWVLSSMNIRLAGALIRWRRLHSASHRQDMPGPQLPCL